MTTRPANLNETEFAVLTDLADQNGSDFAFAESIPETACAKAQRSGYVSQLTQKGYVRLYGDSEHPDMLVLTPMCHRLFDTYHQGEEE